MKKSNLKVLSLGFYSFPFAYFAMYQDFSNSSMFAYLVLIIGMSALAFFNHFYQNNSKHKAYFVIGNLLSFIVSFCLLFRLDTTLGTGWDYGYFKPLTPYQLLLLITILSLAPQMLSMKMADRLKNKWRKTF